MSVLHNPIACARLNVIVLFDYLWMRSWPLKRPHSNLVIKVRKPIYALSLIHISEPTNRQKSRMPSSA